MSLILVAAVVVLAAVVVPAHRFVERRHLT
jgi:hypothetical protein